MYEFSVTSVLLVAIVSLILALSFDWFPGLAKWYDVLIEGQKRFIMAVVVLLTAIIIFVGGCYGLFKTNITCTFSGAIVLVGYILEAVTVNQSTHNLFKPTEKLRVLMFGVRKGRK